MPQNKRRNANDDVNALDDSSSSSDDDSLLMGNKPMFRKRRKAKDSAPDRILGAALADCQKNVDQERRLAMAKKEDTSSPTQVDANIEKANELYQSAQSKKSTEKNQEDDNASGANSPSNSTTSSTMTHHEKVRAEALQTQQTDLFGLERTGSYTAFGLAPSSNFQALQCLQTILETEKTMAPTLKSTLQHHLENGTLHWFLMTKQLCTHKKHQKFAPIPNTLLDWLFSVAVADPSSKTKQDSPHLESLSLGAYETLIKLLDNPDAFLKDTCRFRLARFVSQLSTWLSGISYYAQDTSSNATTCKQSSSSIDVARFVHLWERALVQQLVHIRDDADDQLEEDVSQIILHLLVLGLDQNLCSREASAFVSSTLPSLQRILVHLLNIVARQKEQIDAERPHAWLESLAHTIADLTLQPGGLFEGYTNVRMKHKKDGYEIYDYLLAQVGVLRLILSTDHKPNNSNAIHHFGVYFSTLVLRRCLKVDDLTWESELTHLLKSWNDDSDKTGNKKEPEIHNTALAVSVLALQKLVALLNHPNSYKDDSLISGKLIGSVIEISHLCLQASTACIVWNRKDVHVGMAYEQMERLCGDIAGKTSMCVLSDPHLLRANYYVNAMRHYPRLMKTAYASQEKNTQATLDQWMK